MKTNPIFSRALLVAGLLLGATALIANDGAAAAAGSETDATKPAKPGIAKGMSADEVRKVIGEPKRIKQIESAELKAESWIYRRKLRTETTQEPVGTQSQPAFIGMGMGDANGLGTINVSIYRLKHTTFYQMTALLMVDDTMIEARQWVETEVNYEG